MADRQKKKEGQKCKSLNISIMKRPFYIKKKAIFIVFEGLSFGGEKNMKIETQAWDNANI